MGSRDDAILSPELALKNPVDDRRVMSTAKTVETDRSCRGKRGHMVYFRTLKTPVCDSNNELIGMQGIFRRITPQKKAERKMMIAEQVAEACNRELTSTSAPLEEAVSHANTPAQPAVPQRPCPIHLSDQSRNFSSPKFALCINIKVHPHSTTMNHWRLLIQSGDKTGLVHRLTGILYRHGCNVLVNHEFADPDTNRFFMRTEFVGEIDELSVLTESRSLLPEDATVKLVKSGRPRITVLASREHHCLADLLIRHEYDELAADLQAVISNHEPLGELVQKFDVPFHHVPVTSDDRGDHEQALLKIIEPLQSDYLVLAKYMRVLSPEFVGRFPSRMINIHHSFLPAFVGARPYHQAFERGVKIIGATAHFVSNDLDAGPIIVQEILPVDHTHNAQDLARAGRDVERRALSKALRLVLEDRVFLNGNRTVIFE